ncbi:MAG: tetratricopeptide repeat protein [Ignavibacteriae bacterium]|nr:tetratricopeptide repeat protein [Ignavibacteriota bacterium]
MENNLHNNYLFKAIDSYPYDLEKAVEALNYALAYDPENVKALCLMAQVYNEQLGDHEKAKEYYAKALASRMDIPEVYPDYIRLLVNNDDFEEAQKLIDFALTVKGIDKASIMLNQAYMFEAQREFEKAEEALNEAKMFGLNNNFIDYVDEVLSRVTKKRKEANNKERKSELAQKKAVKEPEKNWFSNRLNNLL